MIKEKLVYRLAWYDWNGGAYDRSFDTEEERAAFIPRIKKTDHKGNINYYKYEVQVKV